MSTKWLNFRAKNLDFGPKIDLSGPKLKMQVEFLDRKWRFGTVCSSDVIQ